MSKRSHIKPVVAALGVAFAGTITALPAQAADNPFAQNRPMTGLVAASGLSVLEGKCGEGKCGSLRVRKMIDTDSDGTITRQEYVAWGVRTSNREFDRIAGSGDSASPEKVFNSFEEWERISQEAG